MKKDWQMPIFFHGAPDRIRTYDLELRSLLLYPAELPGRTKHVLYRNTPVMLHKMQGRGILSGIKDNHNDKNICSPWHTKAAETPKKTAKPVVTDKTVGELADDLDNDEPLLPTYSKEDELLKDAAKDLEEPFFEEESQKKKTHKLRKFFIILLVLLLIAGAGAGGWYLVFKKKIFSKSGTPTATETKETKVVTPDAKPVVADVSPSTVAYAFKTGSSEPYTLYYRPATGGDRVVVKKLDSNFNIMYHDVVKSSVVFGSDTMVYASTDAGKSYSVIYQTAGGGVITSLKLSSEGTRLAIGLIPNFGDNVKGKVISVDLKGKDSKDLFEADKYAIYTIGWSDVKQTFAYAEGCYACDGGRSALKLRDLKAKTAKDLVPGSNVKALGGAQAVSDDMTKLVYVESTYDPAIKVEGPFGYYSAAPYKVQLLDIETAKLTPLTTIGTKNEKNANGTEKLRQFYVGFLAGTNVPYYAEGNALFTVDGSKPNLELDANAQIFGVYFVTHMAIVSASGKSTDDFSLTHYNGSDKKITSVFTGDNNTVVLGVTTK